MGHRLTYAGATPAPGQGRAAVWLLLVVVMAAIAGTWVAMQRWWLPPVASVEGEAVDESLHLLLAITGAVFVLVQLLLVIFALRFSDRGEGRALYWHDNPRLEAGWTAVTALILTSLTIWDGILWVRMHSPAPPDALVVDVWAEQFGWRYRYPGPDGQFGRTDPHLISPRNPLGLDMTDPASQDDIVTRELHLVERRPVKIRLHAKDVIHSFFLPELRFKQDAVPGRIIERHFTPNRSGRFTVACAELCGVGHFVMSSVLVVEPQQAFDAWLAAQAAAGMQLASR